MDYVTSSTASTPPATAHDQDASAYRRVKALDLWDLWDLEIPIHDAKAITTLVKVLTDEMLRHPHPSVTMEDHRVVMIENRTIEALHYAIARLENATAETVTVLEATFENMRTARDQAAA